jgi:hypothetical protein
VYAFTASSQLLAFIAASARSAGVCGVVDAGDAGDVVGVGEGLSAVGDVGIALGSCANAVLATRSESAPAKSARRCWIPGDCAAFTKGERIVGVSRSSCGDKYVYWSW